MTTYFPVRITASSNPVSPTFTLTRSTGIAPLAVFFDASGTTASGFTKPFHELEFSWNFGDATDCATRGSVAGTWDTGSRAGVSTRNTARGPIASHVFQAGGTFNIVLTVTDGTNTNTSSQSIVVTAQDDAYPTTNTVVVSTSGNFASKPTGATEVTSSDFDSVINTHIGDNKRILFRGGETFTSNTSRTITNSGWTIGSFGSGSAIIDMAVNGPLLAPGGGGSDGRLMDLEVDGNAGGSSVTFITPTKFDRLTMLRVNIHDVYLGMTYSTGNLTSPTAVWQEHCLMDSTIANFGSYGLIGFGEYFGLLGNTFGPPTGAGGAGDPDQHTVRLSYSRWLVINSNTFLGANTDKAALTIRANTTYGGITYDGSKYIMVQENKNTAANEAGSFAIGPTSTSSSEDISDAIFDRNWFKAGTATRSLLAVGITTDVTIKNNLFDATTGSANGGILAVTDHPDGDAINLSIYNNSFYCGSAMTGNTYRAVDLRNASNNFTGCSVVNNFAYAPYNTTPLMIDGTGASAYTASNNSSNSQVKTPVTGTYTTVPAENGFMAAVGDWVPIAASYAIDGGTTTGGYVRTDFGLNTIAAPREMGAWQV